MADMAYTPDTSGALQEPAQSLRDASHPLAEAAVDFEAENIEEQAPWNNASYVPQDSAHTVEQPDNIFGPAHEFD